MSVGHIGVYISTGYITQGLQIKKMLKTMILFKLYLICGKPELSQKPFWHSGDVWLWRRKTVSVVLFYLSLSKGQREDKAELRMQEGVHRKVNALQSIFACETAVHGSSWWKLEQKCVCSFTVIIGEALCTVDLRNAGDTYFPLVFNVQNEGD